MSLVKAPAPPGILNRLEVDAATIAALAVLAASIVAVIVGAIQGSTTTFGLTQTEIAYVGVVAGVLMILGRSIISGFQNKGVAAATGVITRVEFYISTWVGSALTVLTWGTAAIASIQGVDVSALGLSTGTLGRIGAYFALATLIGHGVQLALQNSGFSASQIAPAADGTPTVASRVVFTQTELADYTPNIRARAARAAQPGPEQPITIQQAPPA